MPHSPHVPLFTRNHNTKNRNRLSSSNGSAASAHTLKDSVEVHGGYSNEWNITTKRSRCASERAEKNSSV